MYLNWSAGPVALVPPKFITVTSTVPAAPAGVTTVIEPSLLTVNDVASTAPKYTALAVVKPVPLMVTVSPPAAVAVFGETPVTVGAGSRR